MGQAVADALNQIEDTHQKYEMGVAFSSTFNELTQPIFINQITLEKTIMMVSNDLQEKSGKMGCFEYDYTSPDHMLYPVSNGGLCAYHLNLPILSIGRGRMIHPDFQSLRIELDIGLQQ